jgi:hypothetical protein
VDQFVTIGPDGPETWHQVVFPADWLDWCLAQLHADLVWARTGERVGPYADVPVDLDVLPPQAKQGVLDEFAKDLEARREPRHRFSHVADAAPVPVPAAPLEPPPGFSAEDGEWVTQWMDD